MEDAEPVAEARGREAEAAKAEVGMGAEVAAALFAALPTTKRKS